MTTPVDPAAAVAAVASVAAVSPLAPQLTASHAAFLAERPAGADEDVHMLASIVDHVIERCSAVADVVFDPFAGFGTSVERAIMLGRSGVGIELLPERVEQLLQRVPQAQMIEGDARELSRLLAEHTPAGAIASVDLIISSPPYMTSTDHDADPLTAYELDNGDYGRYLAELGLVAAQCARALKPGGYIVWNVADIHHAGVTTPLISDCSRVLARFFQPVGVTEIVWDTYPHDLVRDALLVFKRGA